MLFFVLNYVCEGQCRFFTIGIYIYIFGLDNPVLSRQGSTKSLNALGDHIAYIHYHSLNDVLTTLKYPFNFKIHFSEKYSF